MKIGIVGTGAVGGYFGAKLKLAGCDIVFLSRGKTLEKLKTNGLTLETKNKTSIIKDAVFTDDPSKLKNCLKTPIFLSWKLVSTTEKYLRVLKNLQQFFKVPMLKSQ